MLHGVLSQYSVASFQYNCASGWLTDVNSGYRSTQVA
jgi:hypothetical protein